jgi:lysophospholipase L1-like esterase
VGSSFRRYVALGDSGSESLIDGPATALGAWTDRFAATLASRSPGLHYANLSVRASRARDVRRYQLPAALSMAPDLATVSAGMNDVFRPGYCPERTVAEVEEVFAALRAQGCEVVTMTFPDIGRIVPVLRFLRTRQLELNAGIAEAAARHGVPVLDLYGVPLAADRQMWNADRIHGSALGHARIATGVAELVGIDGLDARWRDASAPALGPFASAGADLRWFFSFLLPFTYRALRGRGPDVAGAPRRPWLQAVLPAMPACSTAVEAAARNPLVLAPSA